MEFQNTRTSDLRSTKRKKSKTRPEPRKHSKNPPSSPLFFRYYGSFFEIFWIASKGPAFICFDILQHNGCQKIPKGPLLHFSALWHCSKISFFWNFFGKIFKVTKGSPLQFFSCFATSCSFTKPEGSPLLHFLTLDIAPTLAVLGLFLVGAFLVKSAQLLQWLVFFSFFFVRLQSHSDWSTFLTTETTKTIKAVRPSPDSGNWCKGSNFHFLLF